jgi:SAM-dependent methyltransferase
LSGLPWWDERAGFFGEFYVLGDHSIEGHLTERRQSVDERTVSEVDGLVRLLELTSPSRILDVPCGYGRHTIELALRGYEVVGNDINELHLEIARKKAQQQGVCPNFLKENMLFLDHPCEFDVLINMFYSFGFFNSDAENMMVLKNFFSALKPGGIFLMHTDVNIPRITSGKYKTAESRELESGGNLHICEHYNHVTKRIDGSWTIEANDKISSKPYSVRVYDENEFKNLCIEVGFESCLSYGDWFGGSYRQDSEEIIFVATKAL